MRPGLLHPGRDVLSAAADTNLQADLQLDGLWQAMARGDDTLYQAARAVMLAPLTDPAALVHRRDVLGDCLHNGPVVRALHRLTAQAVAAEQKEFRAGARPEALLNRALRTLETSLDHLRQLRDLASRHAGAFASHGFTRLFASLRLELEEDFLKDAVTLVAQLQFEHGILAEARLGSGNKGTGFRLSEPLGKGRDTSVRRFRKSGLTFTAQADNEESWRELPAFRDRLLGEVAHVTADSADHVRDFFLALRHELGFYVGCLNLAEDLTGLGLPICIPDTPATGPAVSARNLYEPCLALRRREAVGNDLDTGDATLIMVTGTNRGGKSTFLRALGTAQLMAQCGMFAAAQGLTTPIAHGVFTHFRREEDRTMSSGKLDEELARMSAVVDRLRPGALLLCNESFASTNRREGAGIAAETLRALTDAGVRVVFVTHLYDLARQMHAEPAPSHLFLTTERDGSGEATFRIVPGVPAPTAHADDLYSRVFGQ